jgi:asparagine synthase (glutamine-hydrolysing)
MAHRGPDDRGAVSLDGGRVLLAHRRLSVIDLSGAGRQPMRHPSRDLWIAYNGEVYDFATVRAGLEARGASFRSRTDTEVVLALYAEQGDGFVDALRGMFAIALWDGERRRLVLARDRIGKKPLYYVETARGLAFASTIQALLGLGWTEPRLREEMLPEYLAVGCVRAPDTLLQGIYKLPPGCFLVHEEGRSRVVRYYEPSFGAIGAPARDEDLADALRESVRLRLVSDVPVGITLSGGVDSSLVAALAAERGPIKTFTVGFRGEEEVSEAVHARAVARHLRAEHHEVWLAAEDVAAALPDLERHIDEPHPNLIWFATYFVCRLAKEKGVTVVLTGDGGDELFFGYERWRALQRAFRWGLAPLRALPSSLRSLATRASRRMLRDEAARELVRRAGAREPIYWGPMFFHPDEIALLLSPSGREVLHARPAGDRWRLQALEAPLVGFVDWVRRTALTGHLVEDFLARLDRMGMAASVEGRAPLLDARVVDLALRWPKRDLRRKAPLRRLVRTFYPPAVIDRPKEGFCAPVLSWLRGGLWETCVDDLHALAEDIPLFDAADLRRRTAHPPATTREASRIWTLVSLARWWRRVRRVDAAEFAGLAHQR